MTNGTICPDPCLLSHFRDQEIGAEEENKIRRHLEACPECRAKLELMGRGEGIGRAALARSPSRLSLRAPSPECLSPEDVSAYVQRLLSPAEGERVERHLHTCDVCLSEVMEAFRIASSLIAAKKTPVPAALQVQVASLWESPPAKEQPVSFSHLVIQIAKRGLTLLEQHLVPPLLDVQEIFAPLPAYRAGETPAVLNLRLAAENTEIRATVVQEEKGVALKLTLLNAAQEGLAGQRVFLRQQGRAIFSAKTDQEGVLHMPRLEPGIYEVACPGINATFQLELCT